jgi:hypothetical protein
MASAEYKDLVALIAFEEDRDTLRKIVKMARGQIKALAGAALERRQLTKEIYRHKSKTRTS